MSLMPGFEGIPPEVWDEMLRRSGELPMLPEPPVYQKPTLAPPPESTFRSRLADALAALPPPAAAPGQSAGQSAVRGLLSGASRGFAGQTQARESREDRVRTESNALARAESDRNWQSAQATHRARLTEYYRTQTDQRGKVRVTKKMADDMGVPEAVDSYRDPVDVYDVISKRQSVARVPAELAGTLGMTAGAETTPANILSARNFLKPPSASQQAGVAGFDPDAVAQGIHEGTLPPDPSGYSRGQWGVIAGKLQKLGTDVTKLTLNYRGVRQQVTSMNQNQLLSYRGAIMKAAPTLDYTEELVDELEKAVPTGSVKELTRAQLAAITRGAYGEKAANLATQIVGQINGPLNGEMATVYSRGGVPTDEARRGVQRQVNENMGTSNLKAAFRAMRRDLNFAQTAMDEAGAWSPWNPTPGGVPRPFDLGPRTIPDSAPGGGAPEEWVRDPATGRLVKKGGR